MYEKRKAKRLEEKSEITITIVSGGKKSPEEKIMYNQSNDISVLGARIKANIFLPIDTLLKIDFTLKNPHQMMISTLGKVKWIKSLFANESHEAGVEFVHTPSDVTQQLAFYISYKKNVKYLNPV
jgi:hypothetical protein